LFTAGNHGTGQVSVTFNLELKTTIAGLNTGLLTSEELGCLYPQSFP